MDGVLMHSSEAHARAFHRVLSPFGVAAFDYASIAGMRTEEAVAQILSGHNITPSKSEFKQAVETKRKLALEEIRRLSPLAKNCKAALQELAPNYPLALGSSASRHTVDLFLELSNTHSIFKGVVSGNDVSRSKPDPEVFLTCAKLLKISPQNCLVIEDSDRGIEAAIAAGMAVIKMGKGNENSLPSGVHAVISDLREILGIVIDAKNS